MLASTISVRSFSGIANQTHLKKSFTAIPQLWQRYKGDNSPPAQVHKGLTWRIVGYSFMIVELWEIIWVATNFRPLSAESLQMPYIAETFIDN